jgi:hypothetical protein|uniref:Uncharacterized protein n=2 Tax=Picea TaxID=3328 RepID=A0A101LZF2_PICGL|nr:hypothetical protein ABT39_MTgene5158 [Picea glauca]QHR92872.1 hypothetical protein Q903MT_gene6920 [Picea sitchensis]
MKRESLSTRALIRFLKEVSKLVFLETEPYSSGCFRGDELEHQSSLGYDVMIMESTSIHIKLMIRVSP